MIPRKSSLQFRLTLLVLGTVMAFGLLAGYMTYKNAMLEADEMFDAQLAQFAQNLMVIVAHTDTDDELTEFMPPATHKYQQELAFQVWSMHERAPRILLHSNNLSGMSNVQMPVVGYSSGEWGGEQWRFYRQREEQRGVDVLVGQNNRGRNDLAREMAWHNVAPFLFGLPVLAVVAIFAIRFGLNPLRELTDSLDRLSPEQINPVALPDAPKEIAPVVVALNSLLVRIARTIENERRFTADASHELRTPLAALQAQVQAAQLSDNEAERNESLEKVLQGAERMAHLVDQLLTLSRLDEFSSLSNPETINLAELTRECCADIGTSALAKNIEISFAPEAQPTIAGASDMLRILLRNLLDNAIRYTPPDGRVAVTLRLTGTGQIELDIADSGIGVDDAQLAMLGQRFNRMSPSVADGVGLGLSIAQRIADIHHASISFSRTETLGGLSVKLLFPVA